MPDRRRFLMNATALSALLAGRNAFAKGEMALLEAINQAGRQRMLSQRMAKFYAQGLRRVREDEAKQKLAASMGLFEAQLGNLQRLPQTGANAPIADTYARLGSLWQTYGELLKQPASEGGLKQVAALSESVLATANEGTVKLEKLQGNSLGQLVNLAGRERMLSQRMAKFYFFRQCGLKGKDVDQGLEQARTEFVAALDKLGGAPENTRPIKDWLAMAQTQWMFFDDAIKSGESAEAERHVAVTAENLLEAMDKLTGLYTAL